MGSISDGVKLSWDDPNVRRDRSKRWRCVIDGTEYSSVNQAARATGIFGNRDHEHIPWRRQLVLNAERGDGKGLLDQFGRTWRVIRVK